MGGHRQNSLTRHGSGSEEPRPESPAPLFQVEPTRRNCPACDHDRYEILLSVTAGQVCSANSTYRRDALGRLGVRGDSAYPVGLCGRCGFAFATLLPTPQFLETVYDDVIDPDQGFFESTGPTWVAHQLRLGSSLLDSLSRVFGAGSSFRVLDLGCGYGSLVRAIQGPRVSCEGFETSPRRTAFLGEQGLSSCTTLDEVRSRGPFHAAVLSDVLEHVPAPRATLALCRDILIEGGLLLVNVPNFDEMRWRVLRRQLESDSLLDRELNPWEHLNYFSPDSLDRMLSAYGFGSLDQHGSVDVGLRRGLRGLRKWGNAAKSVGRLARQLLSSTPQGTCRIVQRTAAPDGRRPLG